MLAALLCLSVCPSVRLSAQSPTFTITGRLLRIRNADTTALPNQWVVAHRIGQAVQGPVDSMRSDAAGRFRFTLPPPDTSDVIVVSTRHHGIGYFSEPVQSTQGVPPMLELAVYDTSTSGAPLVVGMRHVVLTREQNGTRRVLDIFQIANNDGATRVGRDSLAAVWSTRLPAGVLRPQPGEGDLPPSAVRFADDRVLVSAAFPPGLKQVVVTYDLPNDARRFAVPIDQPTERLELFVEDSTSVPESDALYPDEPVNIEGRTFRRYAADSLASGDAPAISLAAAAAPRRDTTWIVVVLAALVLAGTAAYALKRRARIVPAGAPAGRPDAPRRGSRELAAEPDERLTAMIAALDDRFAGHESDTPAEAWQAYQQRRRDLKEELARRLARR